MSNWLVKDGGNLRNDVSVSCSTLRLTIHLLNLFFPHYAYYDSHFLKLTDSGHAKSDL